MKRIILVSLALFYVIASSGIGIQVHFCGGKLQSVSLAQSGSKACCDKKTKKDCCQTEALSFKIKNTQEHLSRTVLPSGGTISQPVFYSTTFDILLSSPAHSLRRNFVPPIWSADIHLLNGVFLI